MNNYDFTPPFSHAGETLMVFRPFRPIKEGKITSYLRKIHIFRRYCDWLGLYRDYDANPRSHDYMDNLSEEIIKKYDLKNVIKIDEDASFHSIDKTARQIILFYPDAIGLGQSKYERKVLSYPCVWIVNGRKRIFPLTLYTHIQLCWRRFLASTRIADIFLGIVLFVVAAPLALYDAVRQKND